MIELAGYWDKHPPAHLILAAFVRREPTKTISTEVGPEWASVAGSDVRSLDSLPQNVRDRIIERTAHV